MRIHVAGTSPRNEEGMLDACMRWVVHLNAAEPLWAASVAVPATRHIDAKADSLAGAEPLRIRREAR